MITEKLIEYAQNKVFKSESGSDKDGNSPALHFDQDGNLTYASGRKIDEFKQMESLVIRDSSGKELDDKQKEDLFNEINGDGFNEEKLKEKGLIATKQDKIKAFTEDAVPRINEIKTEIANHEDSKIKNIDFDKLPTDIQYVIFDNKYTTGKVSTFPKMMGHVNSYQNAKNDAERQEARQNIAYESFTLSGKNRNEERNKNRFYASLGIDPKDDPKNELYDKAIRYHEVDKYPGLIRPDLNKMASELNITKSEQQQPISIDKDKVSQPYKPNESDVIYDLVKDILVDKVKKSVIKDGLTLNKDLFKQITKYKPSYKDELFIKPTEKLTIKERNDMMNSNRYLDDKHPLSKPTRKKTMDWFKFFFPGNVEYDAFGKMRQAKPKQPIAEKPTPAKSKDGYGLETYQNKLGASLQLAANSTGNPKRVIKSYQDAINDDNKKRNEPMLKTDGIFGKKTASATIRHAPYSTVSDTMKKTEQKYRTLYGSRYGGASQSKSTMPGNLSRPEPKPTPKPTTQPRHGYASHSQKQMEKSRTTPERKEDRYVPGNIVAPKPEPKPQTKQDFMRESEEKSRNSRSSGGGRSSSGGFGSFFGGLFG